MAQGVAKEGRDRWGDWTDSRRDGSISQIGSFSSSSEGGLTGSSRGKFTEERLRRTTEGRRPEPF
jgi:hypothetical protein